MKKFLLSFATLMAMSFGTSAQTTETFDCSTLGSSNIQPMTDVTIGKVTLSFDKAGGSNQPGYFSNGNDIRLYANNEMTVTAAEGYKVDKLVFTISNNSQLGAVAASLGTVAPQAVGDKELTWTGEASGFTFTVSAKAEYSNDTNKAGQFRFSSVAVTYSEGEGETDPDEPDAPVVVYTVAEALSVIASGDIPSGDVQVKGIISDIQEVNTSYGNATYTIKDALTDEEGLLIYRGYWLNGDKFTTANQIAVGGEVVVEGKLVDYNGTSEMTSGGKVVSYTAPEGGNPDPETPEQPTGENVTFNFTQPSTLDVAYSDEGESGNEVVLTGLEFTSGVITLSFDAAEGASNQPRLYYGSGNAAGWTMRFYKDNTFTVAADEGYNVTSIVFEGSNITGLTVSSGTLSGTTWTAGDAVGSVSFSKEATGNNPTVKTMTVYYADAAGVEDVAVDTNAPVEYFNLQGVRVVNPENGLFIRRQGNTVSKVVIR